LYLLPTIRPSHPDERRRMLAAAEWGGTFELLTLNAGLSMLALGGLETRSLGLIRASRALAKALGVRGIGKAGG
jgi:hypothetical protein